MVAEARDGPLDFPAGRPESGPLSVVRRSMRSVIRWPANGTARGGCSSCWRVAWPGTCGGPEWGLTARMAVTRGSVHDCWGFGRRRPYGQRESCALGENVDFRVRLAAIDRVWAGQSVLLLVHRLAASRSARNQPVALWRPGSSRSPRCGRRHSPRSHPGHKRPVCRRPRHGNRARHVRNYYHVRDPFSREAQRARPTRWRSDLSDGSV